MSAEIPRLVLEARALQRQGRRREAIDALRRLLALRPEAADDWYNLGYLLRQEGRFDAALDAYAEALAREVERPEEVHLNRAVILTDHLRRDADAERELRAAIARAPQYVPAWLNLGNLQEERGERDAAIASYERILPRADATTADDAGLRHEALARMAHLAPISSVDDPLLARIDHAARTHAGLEDSVRATLWFALGRALDRLGETTRAFAAFEAGNRHAQRTGRRYDAARFEQTVTSLIAATPGIADEAASVPAHRPPRPLFICGMFRSGSTLIERVLAAHPQVTAGGELDWFPRLAAGPLALHASAPDRLPQARAESLASDYLDHLRRLYPEAGREGHHVSDKRPDNFLLLGLIKRVFPDARIVHTVRNPLDTGLSIFSQHLSQERFPYSSDLGHIGHYIAQYRRLMAHWKARFPETIHDFDYDAFVRAPRATLAPLLDFLGLPWHEDCLRFHLAGGAVKTASYWQVREPLHDAASGRWRPYAARLSPLIDALRAGGVAVEA
jgi:tetratricopeptide (TPR) repeat protein